jgi:hypothetical protein
MTESRGEEVEQGVRAGQGFSNESNYEDKDVHANERERQSREIQLGLHPLQVWCTFSSYIFLYLGFSLALPFL